MLKNMSTVQTVSTVQAAYCVVLPPSPMAFFYHCLNHVNSVYSANSVNHVISKNDANIEKQVNSVNHVNSVNSVNSVSNLQRNATSISDGISYHVFSAGGKGIFMKSTSQTKGNTQTTKRMSQ